MSPNLAVLPVSRSVDGNAAKVASRRGSRQRTQPQSPVEVARMIREFKTTPCNLEAGIATHDHRCCPFSHCERDRRRTVMDDVCRLLYRAEPCSEQFDDQRVCPNGDACDLCHSTAELLYHPDFFRKRLCHQAKRCPRGRFCAFAHSRLELLVPCFGELEKTEPTEEFIMYEFKTQWCPIGGPHDWENCVYAHTYRDWRRVAALGYSSRPCPQWTQSVATGPQGLSYEQRCPQGMACPLAHGAKEQLYHPQFYKTSPCSKSNCKRGALCAFTHGGLDVRKPDGNELQSLSLRDPIPQANKMLEHYQPTSRHPPRYHALEDPLRGHASSSSSDSMAYHQASGCHPWDNMICPNESELDSSAMGVHSYPYLYHQQPGGAPIPFMLVPTHDAPYFCPWMDPSLEQLQDAFGDYGNASAELNQAAAAGYPDAQLTYPMGYAPVMWNGPAHQPFSTLTGGNLEGAVDDEPRDVEGQVLASKARIRGYRSSKGGMKTPSSLGSPELADSWPMDAVSGQSSTEAGDADGSPRVSEDAGQASSTLQE